MYDKQKVIDLAISQIGYHEKASNNNLDSFTANSGGNNWNKYARDLDKLTGFYNGPKNIGPQGAWCDIFVDWLFVTAYGRSAAQYLLCQPDYSAGAGCYYSALYYQQKGQFHKSNPQPGDQIFFSYRSGEVSHTGLVVAVDATTVTAVEGNSDDCVSKRVYALSNGYIYGYGRPKYGTQAASTTPAPAQTPTATPKKHDTCIVTLDILRVGDSGGQVKAMQTLLIEQGYTCGGYGADGDFGNATRQALINFQRTKALGVDGECGSQTWKKLLSFGG